MTTALETVDLGRRYLMTWGLRNCSLRVPEGSITGLVGPNGAGKSTLLRLAAGISKPTTGSLKVFDRRVNPNSLDFLDTVGYLDQSRPLYKQFRVDEIVKLGSKLNHSFDYASVTRWLEELHIPFDWKISFLSIGQQAQVALAMCMGKHPKLLLLDEPMANLDPLARRGVTQILLDSVAEHETTVLLSSHIVSELESICDYLIILSKSQVQIAGTVESLLADHHVLTGPAATATFGSLNVISSTVAGRQGTYLIEGVVGPLDDDWQVASPDLEEIVLAYLEHPIEKRANRPRGTSEGGPS